MYHSLYTLAHAGHAHMAGADASSQWLPAVLVGLAVVVFIVVGAGLLRWRRSALRVKSSE